VSEYRLQMGEASAHMLAGLLDECAADGSNSFDLQQVASTAASTIRAQIPLAVPEKIGAIVRTDNGFSSGVYQRWALETHTLSPWIQAGDHEKPYRTDEIGRIVAILAEGVYL
jgi:hypothetical protein